MTHTRTCTKCKETKTEESNFRLNKQRKQYRTVCTICETVGRKKYYQENTELLLKKAKDYRIRNKVHMRALYERYDKARPTEFRMVRSSRARALKIGIEHTITVEDIYVPEICPALGIKLRVNKGRPGDDSPSLDRIDPTKGYIKGNIQVLCNLANRIKSNATPEQVMKVALFLHGESNE